MRNFILLFLPILLFLLVFLGVAWNSILVIFSATIFISSIFAPRVPRYWFGGVAILFYLIGCFDFRNEQMTNPNYLWFFVIVPAYLGARQLNRTQFYFFLFGLGFVLHLGELFHFLDVPQTFGQSHYVFNSVLFQKNAYMVLNLLHIVAGFWLILNGKIPKWCGVFLLLSCLVLFSSEAKAIKLFFLFSIGTGVLIHFKDRPATRRLSFIPWGSFLLVLLYIFLNGDLVFYQKLKTLVVRQEIWNGAKKIILNSSYFGSGPDGFRLFFPVYSEWGGAKIFILPEMLPATAHNFFLEHWVNFGVLSLLILIPILWVYLKTIRFYFQKGKEFYFEFLIIQILFVSSMFIVAYNTSLVAFFVFFMSLFFVGFQVIKPFGEDVEFNKLPKLIFISFTCGLFCFSYSQNLRELELKRSILSKQGDMRMAKVFEGLKNHPNSPFLRIELVKGLAKKGLYKEALEITQGLKSEGYGGEIWFQELQLLQMLNLNLEFEKEWLFWNKAKGNHPSLLELKLEYLKRIKDCNAFEQFKERIRVFSEVKDKEGLKFKIDFRLPQKEKRTIRSRNIKKEKEQIFEKMLLKTCLNDTVE